MNVFISYRRDDSILAARLLHGELSKRYGDADVFMDIENIGYGDDFITAIDARLDEADVVVVVIGPRWEEMIEQRIRGDDWVRHEVARALKLRGESLSAAAAGSDTNERPRIIPVLVAKAPPLQGPLPEELKALQPLTAMALDERALRPSINSLVEAINQKSFESRVGDEVHEKRARSWRLVLAGLIGLAVFFAGWVKLFDFFGLDTRVASATMWLADLVPVPPPWSGKVVLVGIDKASEKAIGRGFDRSWRSEHARLIGNAAAAGALAVAFDLVLDAPSSEAADASLEQALRATQATMPVVFGVQDMSGNAPDLLPRFAPLAHFGVACAGLKLGQARSLPLAVQRLATPAAPATASARERFVVHPSLGLAAYSGGGRVEPLDEVAQTVQVLVPREQRSQVVSYFAAETVRSAQPGCEAVTKGDRAASQLFDPFALPALREAPQRLAYERVVDGDPATLAALKGQIVLVGVQLPGEDVFPLGVGGGERWGVELIAVQIDGLARGAAIRPQGGIAQWVMMTAMAALGAVVAHRLRQRPLPLRLAVGIVVLLVYSLAVFGWYRMEGQLIALPYGLIAFLLGVWLMRKLTKGSP
jgi:CHASE2 domain-containing sensor protein